MVIKDKKHCWKYAYLLLLLGLLLCFSQSFSAHVHPLLEIVRKEVVTKGFQSPQILQSAPGMYGFTLPAITFQKIYPITTENGQTVLPVFITTKDGTVNLTHKHSIAINSKLGRLHTARITFEQLDILAADEEVVLIEPATLVRPLLDVSIPNMKINTAQTRFGVNGSGVVVGVIDDALDLTNSDFKDASGSTRVLSLWDHTMSGTPPFGYAYGHECTQLSINQSTCGSAPGSGDNHGTHVTGIAAGNGRNTNTYVTLGQYAGVAPTADIVFVRTDFASDRIIDGLLYIADKAVSLGKPWVTNMSLGGWWGPRDGTSTFEQFVGGIRNVYGGGGNVIVVAAGNENYDPLAHGREGRNHASRNSAGTLPFGSGSSNIVRSEYTWLEIWYPNSANYEISLIAPSGRLYGPYGPGQGTFGPDEGALVYDPNNLNDTVNTDGFVFVHNEHWAASGGYANPHPLSRDRQIMIILADIQLQQSGYWYHLASGNWQIQLSNGSGRWDTYITDANITDQLAAFSDADNDNTRRITEPANAENIITVGSYNTRPCWPSRIPGNPDECHPGDGTYWTLGSESYFSSRGPTRDGRPKPDCLAAGSMILSSKPSQTTFPPDELWLLTTGQEHYATQGTSMAAPHITGLVALMLDLKPTLTFEQIKNCIINSTDAQGKVDAELAVQCANDGIEGEEEIVIPNTFSVSQNYPNPFNAGTVIPFDIPPVDAAHSPRNVNVDIINILGQVVAVLRDTKLAPGSYSVEWDGRTREGTPAVSGVYFYRVAIDAIPIAKKMMLIK